MKTKIDFEQFVDVLIEAKKTIAIANEIESAISEMAQRRTAAENQLTIITKELNGLAATYAERKQAMEQELISRQASADNAFAAYKVNQESLRQQEEKTVLDAKRVTDSTIAIFKAQESDAKQATVSAQAELKTLTEALDRARHDASKLARLMNVGQA